MIRYVFFPAQYGTPDRWVPCTVDAFGVWRCNGMYMPAPKPDLVR